MRLAVGVDLFSRKVVGWSIGDSLAVELVGAALRQAIERRRPEGKRLLHHSDRGSQYTSEAYQRILQTLGITCSMSRSGCCYDNAAMERFIRSFEAVALWALDHSLLKRPLECCRNRWQAARRNAAGSGR